MVLLLARAGKTSPKIGSVLTVEPVKSILKWSRWFSPRIASFAKSYP